LPHRFIMIDAFAAPDALNDDRFLVLAIGGNDDRDRLSDHFLREIAEQALRRPVPTGDDPVDILADDRIIGGVDDRREETFAFLRALALMSTSMFTAPMKTPEALKIGVG
jgi:hypothetical protein